MKKITFLLFILFVLPYYSFSQLNIGDIAFIGVNTDPGSGADQDHSFTFITLTNIPSGEVIYFTEQGVDINTMAWFGNTEGHYSWTSPAGGISCGTVIAVYESVSSPDVLIASSGTMSNVLNGSGWNLSAGDQVIAYQANNAAASISSCTFIAGIHMEDDQANGETNGWTSTSYSGTGVSYSHLPPGLTNEINCISLFSGAGNPEFDNAKYTGTLTGTSVAILSAINTPANWSTNDVTPFDITTAGFSPNVSCVTCTDPTIPTVTATTNPICEGNSTTLNISGTFNDATQWAIYTGSCGGTLIGTTTTSSFAVSPSSTTTYYIRGEGGCVTPSSCGTITVTVNSQPNAGTDGNLTVCNDSTNIIDLNSLIFGEQPGGIWSRVSGTGGTFNNLAGTFTTSPSASTSIFEYTIIGNSPCPTVSSIVTIYVLPSIDNTISENTTGVLTANESGATYQWYACPNTLLSGETNQNFIPNIIGDYKVEIIDGNGCRRESNCYTVNTLGTKTFENHINFVMYPNPTNGSITIKTDTSGNFNIINQLGQTIKTFSLNSNIENNINVENLANGIYFIKSLSNSQIKTQRLIIKK